MWRGKLHTRVVAAADFGSEDSCVGASYLADDRQVEFFQLPPRALGMSKFNLHNGDRYVIKAKNPIGDTTMEPPPVFIEDRDVVNELGRVNGRKDVLHSGFKRKPLTLGNGVTSNRRERIAKSHIGHAAFWNVEAPRRLQVKGPYSLPKAFRGAAGVMACTTCART